MELMQLPENLRNPMRVVKIVGRLIIGIQHI